MGTLQGTVQFAKALATLRHSGIVMEHREGKFVHCSLSEAPPIVALLEAIFHTLDEDPQLRRDAALGDSIRAMSPLIVCEGSPLWPGEGNGRVVRGARS